MQTQDDSKPAQKPDLDKVVDQDESVWTHYLGVSWDTALALAFVIFLASGLWLGGFYSSHSPYRQQTEALLQGRADLGSEVRGLTWDLAWDNGKIQQVWGLGVPAWRLPFEVLAKICGLKAFPDRVAFAVALYLVIYLCLKFHWKALTSFCSSLPKMWVALAVIPLVASPALLTICRSKFEAYEEALAYGFLASLVLMVWTASLRSNPSGWSFLGLCFFSGFLPFIRPTFVFYGVSSVIVGALVLWKNGQKFKAFIIGPACFGVGIGLLLWSNSIRFGVPGEFGHRLNINTIAPMRYASRFEDPFRREPIPSAAIELVSATFFNRTPPGDSWPWAYQDRIFTGQSTSFRWRELYLSTFDVTWLGFLLGSWYWGGLSLWKRRGSKDWAGMNAVETVILWSVLPVLLLGVFYLRFPFISSRYLLDFGPALVAVIWSGMVLLLRRAHDKKRPDSFWQYAPILLVMWWVVEVVTIKVVGKMAGIGRQEIIAKMEQAKQSTNAVAFPTYYKAGADIQSLGIPFNGSGWGSDGGTESSVVLFVEDPQFLAIDVSDVSIGGDTTKSYDCIQAKIGLEFLERESVTPVPDGMRILLKSPKSKRYLKGIQTVFLGMVDSKGLSAGNSKFRLSKVSWRQEAVIP